MTEELLERELTDEQLEQVTGGIAVAGNAVGNIANSQILQGNTVQVPVNVAPVVQASVNAPVTVN